MKSLVVELTKVFKACNYRLNTIFASDAEAAQSLSNDYNSMTFKDLTYPAVVIFRDVNREYSDPRYCFKFDLKILIIDRSNRNFTTEESEMNVFEKSLYPIMESIEKNIKLSTTIISDYPEKYKSSFKNFYKVVDGECDLIELTINDLKLYK